MDWSNESYVRLYTRDTDDDLILSWEARAVWHEMLRKFDRSGVIALKRGRRGLAAVLRMPPEIVETAVQELLTDGRIRELTIGYFAPNFLEAQEAPSSDTHRKRESRTRRRDIAVAEAAGLPVTKRDRLSGNEADASNRDRDASNRDRDVTKRDRLSGEDASRSLLPDPDPVRSFPPARRPPVVVAPDQDPALKARREIGDRAWEELNAIRQRVGEKFGWRDVRPLHPMDPGRVELAERLRESGSEAETNLQHVLAIAEAEAVTKKTVEWLSGAMFRAESWRKKLSMRLDDARRAPRSTIADSPTMRFERDEDDVPPLRPVAGRER